MTDMTQNQNSISWAELTPQFIKYGKVCRDWCEKTTDGHQAYLTRFRNWIEGPGTPLVELKDLDFVKIQHFVGYYVDRHPPHSQKGMFTTLRAFLSFCNWEGIHAQDFSFAVPTVRSRKLDRVPWTLTQNQIDSILDSIDRSLPLGKRGKREHVENGSMENGSMENGSRFVQRTGFEGIPGTYDNVGGSCVVCFLHEHGKREQVRAKDWF